MLHNKNSHVRAKIDVTFFGKRAEALCHLVVLICNAILDSFEGDSLGRSKRRQEKKTSDKNKERQVGRHNNDVNEEEDVGRRWRKRRTETEVRVDITQPRSSVLNAGPSPFSPSFKLYMCRGAM